MIDETEWTDMLALCSVKALDGEAAVLSVDVFEASIERLRGDLDFLVRAYRPEMPVAERANFVEDLLDEVLLRLRGAAGEVPDGNGATAGTNDEKRA